MRELRAHLLWVRAGMLLEWAAPPFHMLQSGGSDYAL